MKKAEKGTPGYLDYKKKVEIIRTVIYFGIVAAVFFLGYFQTGTRLNLLTVIAILGWSSGRKSSRGSDSKISIPFHRTGYAEEIENKTKHLTVCYDMVITSEDKIMPVDCIVISGGNIFGYTH